MFEEDKNNVVYFPKETTYKIGKITYIVNSHFDEKAEPMLDKIKNLLKADIHASGSTIEFSGGDVV